MIHKYNGTKYKVLFCENSRLFMVKYKVLFWWQPYGVEYYTGWSTHTFNTCKDAHEAIKETIDNTINRRLNKIYKESDC